MKRRYIDEEDLFPAYKQIMHTRLVITILVCVSFIPACAGFDIDAFVAALEAENTNTRGGQVHAEPAAATESRERMDERIAGRGTVFPEAMPVIADESRLIVAEVLDLGFHPAAVSSVDASHAWVVGDDGAIARTRDGGRSWERVDVPGLTTRIAAVSFYDRAHGIVADSGNTVAITSNGGNTWVTETLQRRVRIPEDTFLYTFTDGGLPSRSSFHSAHAHGPATFLVGGTFGEVYLYRNGVWEERTFVSGQTVYGIASASDGTILAATGIGLADNFGIERSSFDHPEWESIVNFTGPPAQGVRLSDNGRLIAWGYPLMGDSFGDQTFFAPDRVVFADSRETLVQRWGVGDFTADAAWVFLNPPWSAETADENTLGLIFSEDGGDSWTMYGSTIETGLAAAALFEPGHALGLRSLPGTWLRELVRLRW